MGSGDFDAEVKNSLRDIQSRVDSLTKAQGRLNGEMRRYGDEARTAFRGHAGMHEAAEGAERLGKTVQELGHAVKGVGGALGEIVHRLTGGAGMAGGFGVIAVAAGAANLALDAFGTAVERATDRAHNAAEANEKLARAIEHADDVARKGAAEGLGGAKDRRNLLAAGGQYAVNDAEFVAQGGAVAPGEAAAGVAAAYGKYHLSDRTSATIQSAQRLAQAGLPFTEAVNQLLAHGGDLTSAKNARRIEATVFNRYTGSRNNDDYNYGAALAATGAGQDGLLDASVAVGAQNARGRAANTARTVSRGDLDARGAAAANANPLAAAILALHQTAEQQLQVQRDTVEHLRSTLKANIANGSAYNAAVDFVALHGAGLLWKGAVKAQRDAEDAAYGSLPGATYGPGG